MDSPFLSFFLLSLLTLFTVRSVYRILKYFHVPDCSCESKGTTKGQQHDDDGKEEASLLPIPTRDENFLTGSTFRFIRLRKQINHRPVTRAYFQFLDEEGSFFQQQGHGCFKIQLGLRSVYRIVSWETAKGILTSYDLIDKPFQYELLFNWLGPSLLTSSGNVWRHKRRLISKGFNSKNLRSFLPTLHRQAELFCHEIASSISSENTLLHSNGSEEANDIGEEQRDGRSRSVVIRNFHQICLSRALSVILETAMGIHHSAKTGGDSTISSTTTTTSIQTYSKSLHEYTVSYIQRVSSPWLWSEFVYQLTPTGKKAQRCIQALKSFTENIIDHHMSRVKMEQEKKIEITAGDGDENDDTDNIDKINDSGKEFKRNSKTRNPDSNGNNVEGEGQRTKQKQYHSTLLDLILTCFDSSEARNEVDTLVFAGHDTTGLAIFYTLFLLGHHPEVQEKLQKQLDTVILSDVIAGGIESNYQAADGNDVDGGGDGDDKGDDLMRKNLPLLDAVMKESLRLFPPVPAIGRKVGRDVRLTFPDRKVDGRSNHNGSSSSSSYNYLIPAGSNVVVDIYRIHRDGNFFREPDSFIPDRFLANGEGEGDNQVFQQPSEGAFLPFSLGQRSCVGSRLAYMEMKIILTHVLKRFHVTSLTPLDELELSTEIVLKPSRPDIFMKFTERRD